MFSVLEDLSYCLFRYLSHPCNDIYVKISRKITRNCDCVVVRAISVAAVGPAAAEKSACEVGNTGRLGRRCLHSAYRARG